MLSMRHFLSVDKLSTFNFHFTKSIFIYIEIKLFIQVTLSKKKVTKYLDLPKFVSLDHHFEINLEFEKFLTAQSAFNDQDKMLTSFMLYSIHV